MTVDAKDTKATPKKKTQTVVIPTIERQEFAATIVGLSSLISHRFAEGAKEQILRKQMKKAAVAREAKNPEAEYLATIYYTKDKEPGFPASGIKRACVDACTFSGKAVTKVMARGAFYIIGDILPIIGFHQQREDIVRLQGRTADIRYRAEYQVPWSITFTVLHNPSILSREAIVNLIEIAGFHVGIGDWRPQKNGSFGMFQVKRGE